MRHIALFVFVILVLVGFGLSGCSASTQQRAGALQLEEHRLVGAPELETLGFQPLQGTQEEILAVHAIDRSRGFSNEVSMVQGNPAILSLGDSGDLLAVLITSGQGQPEQTVRVWKGGKIVLETAAGLPSPVLPLQGLWAYDGHWALEILLTDQSTWAGEVFIDGELMNELQGYDEAFGLQLLAGKPFFFFRRNGHVGYSYDGQEMELEYDEVPHYRCCGESSLNPVQAKNMVAFFAVREKTWFYVELGDFNG
jgi:hypothetical protein